jgi:hypothetical protein
MFAALGLYDMVGLHLGWGTKKTKFVLPLNCDLDSLPRPRDPAEHPLPGIFPSFRACLGVPRHPTYDENFITAALKPVALQHDMLLELVADVSNEDLLASLRLMQVCGINRVDTYSTRSPMNLWPHFANNGTQPSPRRLEPSTGLRWTLTTPRMTYLWWMEARDSHPSPAWRQRANWGPYFG